MLCHVSNMVALRIHDHISIRLLKPKEQVHHLNLSLYDKAGVCQELRGRVLRLNDSPFIFGDMDGREEVIMGRICSCKGFGHGGKFGRFRCLHWGLQRGILWVGGGIRSAAGRRGLVAQWISVY
jgi:hypothetical protein